jgi:amino acid transporter
MTATRTETVTTTRTRGKLGVASITFMTIAASAPLTVLAGGVTTMYGVTGVLGVPLAFILLGIVLVIFSAGYAAMSRYITNAGAFYTYVSRGINREAGVGTSIVALIAYNSVQLAVYGLLGFTVSATLSTAFGWSLPWWIPVLICVAIVAIMGINRVDFSVKVIATFVALESLVVIVYDIVSFAVAPESVSAAPIDPSNLFVVGIGAVLAFGFVSFMGFESAAIYSEEARDPKRTVARATYLGVSIMAVFYGISAWAMAIGEGPSKIVGEAAKSGPDLMFVFLGGHVGAIFVDLAHVLFITSMFAVVVSFHNIVARYFFSLGREGVLPPVLSKVRKRNGAPYIASLTQTGLAAVVVIVFAIAGASWTPPEGLPAELFPVLTMFAWLGQTAGVGLVLLLLVTAVAIFGFFRKERHPESAWSGTVSPLISAVVFLVIFILTLVNFNVLLGQEESNALTFVLPGILIVPSVAAVFWGAHLKRSQPEVYERIGYGYDIEGAPRLTVQEPDE